MNAFVHTHGVGAAHDKEVKPKCILLICLYISLFQTLPIISLEAACYGDTRHYGKVARPSIIQFYWEHERSTRLAPI